MNFEKLVGQKFKEQEFYDLILAELEDNFVENFGKDMHFYFERVEKNLIKITDICYFQNGHERNKFSRTIIEKREWFEIAKRENHMDLMLCRFDRTGFVSSVWKDKTRTQEWSHGWADEGPASPPMTPEEIKEAFLELMGVMQADTTKQKLKSKKSA